MEKALGHERAMGLEGELAGHLPHFNAMARRINDNLFAAFEETVGQLSA
jgi:hypothetical protein